MFYFLHMVCPYERAGPLQMSKYTAKYICFDIPCGKLIFAQYMKYSYNDVLGLVCLHNMSLVLYLMY